jgi:transposase
MFVRSVKVTSSSGVKHEYIRIVASVREKGCKQQKVIANLGRRDTLEAILPQLNRFLTGRGDLSELVGQMGPMVGEEGPIRALDASTWGPVLVVRTLFERLGLWQILDTCDAHRPGPLRSGKDEDRDDWISRIFALVANRLTRPSTEHALAAWLETDYVCDRRGRRYVPCWKQRRRVKVDFTQLQRWYRSLDHLIAHKDRIEVALYHRLRDLFSLQPELVFYDLTSTYFEGRGPAGFAKHGHSRDGKPRHVQVVVGAVMVAGWPIAHHVWAGNTTDKSTVAEVLDDLSQRFEFRRVVFVGDRGMVSASNLAALKDPTKDRDFGFLLGMRRRRNPEVEALLGRVREDRWIDCPVGINAQEKDEPPRTRVQEVSSDRKGVRVFVIDSDERRAYEQARREQAMERARAALEKVQARVGAGQLKDPAKIGAAVERALRPHHGHRYYAWELTDGKLTFCEHPVHLRREKQSEGKYLIQTDQADLTAEQAVGAYKQLNDVERGFRSLKDPIAMRPIYHQTKHRVRAHIFVAALAFLVERLLARALADAGARLSVADAWVALQTVRHVTLQVGSDRRTAVTPGSGRARQVLKALKIRSTRPPAPPKADETTM